VLYQQSGTLPQRGCPLKVIWCQISFLYTHPTWETATTKPAPEDQTHHTQKVWPHVARIRFCLSARADSPEATSWRYWCGLPCREAMPLYTSRALIGAIQLLRIYTTFGLLHHTITSSPNTELKWMRSSVMRSHDIKLQKFRSKYDLRKLCFSSRVVIWNSLPSRVIHAESVNNFKSRLDRF